MTEPVRLFMVAGEPSGDRLGAALVQDLRAKRSVELAGIGGYLMQAEGLKSLFPMSDIAVMGVEAVLRRLPLVLWRVVQTGLAILRQKPDAVVLIDAQVFNRLVTQIIRAFGFKKPVLLYVAPTVWGYAPERARKIKPLYDEILAILPFEPGLMAELGGPSTHYVGHVATREVSEPNPPLEKGLVVLMPGSREREIAHHLPVMRAAVEALKDHPAVTGFCLPTLPAEAQRLREAVQGWAAPVEIISDTAEREARLEQAVMAIATAGTVSLELALNGLPMVLFYAAHGKFVELAQKGQLFALPNIVLGERVIPEEVSTKPNPQTVIVQAKTVLDSFEERQRQAEAFKKVRALIVDGTYAHPREDPADRVLAHLSD